MVWEREEVYSSVQGCWVRLKRERKEMSLTQRLWRKTVKGGKRVGKNKWEPASQKNGLKRYPFRREARTLDFAIYARVANSDHCLAGQGGRCN